MKHVRNIAIVLALGGLLFVTRERGALAANLLSWLLGVVFLGVLAWFVMVMYREHRAEITSLGDRMRLVLYGSIGLAVLTVTASRRMWDLGGGGTVLWIALLALASFGLFSAWRAFRSY